MAATLADYRRKRDFSRTPEPPDDAPSVASTAPIFVVQEHHARALHWDLRIEHGGVLASWAVPKGVPLDPGVARLAIRTEDHPLAYATFSGTIPAGEYGAGTMTIWDAGTCTIERFDAHDVVVAFEGERLRGHYQLKRTGADEWRLRRLDPADDPCRQPMPERIVPMLAEPGALPADEAGWAFEVKWDGVRAVGYSSGGRIRFESRRGNDLTPQYPELRGLGAALGAREAVLDGEIVAFDSQGRPSFERLQRRSSALNEPAIRLRAREVPVVYVLFDLLFLDGAPLCHLPYAERRARLEALALADTSWLTPPYRVADGAALLEASRVQGLEGIIAKRLDSTYQPGRRSPAWRKIKHRLTQDIVIGGYTRGEGHRASSFGALLGGYYAERGDGLELIYAGRAGTGFTDAVLGQIGSALAGIRRETTPFRGGPVEEIPRDAVFVEPLAVAVVEHAGWTNAGAMRAPSFKGFRADIDPRDVRREDLYTGSDTVFTTGR